MSVSERKKIVDEVIEALEAKGLVLVPASELDDMQKRKAEQRLLSRTKLTPYQVIKFDLLPGVKSIKTIKNMAEDGRFGKYEYLIDSNGKHWVLTSALKRMRNE